MKFIVGSFVACFGATSKQGNRKGGKEQGLGEKCNKALSLHTDLGLFTSMFVFFSGMIHKLEST